MGMTVTARSRDAWLLPKGRVSVAHYPPGIAWGPRVLADHELVWLLSGSAVWTVSGSGMGSGELVLQPGTIALSRPGLAESYVWDDHRHSTHAFVHFDLGPAAMLRLGPADTWPLVREGSSHPVLAGLCDHLVALAGADDPAAEMRSVELLNLLVDLFVNGPLPERRTPVGSSVVAAALAHVRDRWAEHGLVIVSVGELAGAAGVSAGHLSREFHAQFHIGPAAALELVRLSSAAMTLQRTHLTLDEVGRAAGFADAYHFSRRFSRAYGEPPGRFRRAGLGHPLAPVHRAGLGLVWAGTLGSR
jgi:AraC-like DNA-binding protein